MPENRRILSGSSPSAPKVRYLILDRWRGIATLAVVAFHSFGAARSTGQVVHPCIRWLKWLSGFGGFGVHLFFVISGY